MNHCRYVRLNDTAQVAIVKDTCDWNGSPLAIIVIYSSKKRRLMMGGCRRVSWLRLSGRVLVAEARGPLICFSPTSMKGSLDINSNFCAAMVRGS